MSQNKDILSTSKAEVEKIYQDEGLSEESKGVLNSLLSATHMEGLKLLKAYQRILQELAGISATPASFGGGGGASAEADTAKPEKKIFKVKITNTASIEKLPAAKALQGELGVSLKEASDLLKEGTVLEKEMPAAAADDLIAKLAQFKVIAEKV